MFGYYKEWADQYYKLQVVQEEHAMMHYFTLDCDHGPVVESSRPYPKEINHSE